MHTPQYRTTRRCYDDYVKAGVLLRTQGSAVSGVLTIPRPTNLSLLNSMFWTDTAQVIISPWYFLLYNLIQLTNLSKSKSKLQKKALIAVHWIGSSKCSWHCVSVLYISVLSLLLDNMHTYSIWLMNKLQSLVWTLWISRRCEVQITSQIKACTPQSEMLGLVLLWCQQSSQQVALFFQSEIVNAYTVH